MDKHQHYIDVKNSHKCHEQEKDNCRRKEAIMNWYLLEETGLVYKPLTVLILRKIQPKSKLNAIYTFEIRRTRNQKMESVYVVMEEQCVNHCW